LGDQAKARAELELKARAELELKARAELELKARAELELKARAELEQALHLLGFRNDRKNALHPVTSCRRFCKRPTPTTPTGGNY
jgi:membrane protein involved in colicin uptake